MSFSNTTNNIDRRTTKNHQDSGNPDGCLLRSAVYHASVPGQKSDVEQESCAAESLQATPPFPKPEVTMYERWIASSMHVKKLPFYHLLGDHHCVFEQNQLDAVTVRLQDMFQISSVSVKYNRGDEARSAFAECATLENVEFVVVFWAQDGKFIAEVQRTKGASEHYYEYARRILDAVDGNEKLLDLKPNDPLDVHMIDYESEEQCIQTVFARCVPIKQPHWLSTIEADVADSIELVASMVESDRYDCLCTGLESLKSMTNVRISGCLAKSAAAVVLNNTTIITQRITSFAALAAGGSNGNSIFRDLEFCALTILGQSVGLVDERMLGDFVRLYPGVTQSLLAGAVHPNTHIAYLSTHTLSVLYPHVAGVAELPLQRMQLVGATSHAALGYACERLIRCVNGNQQLL